MTRPSKPRGGRAPEGPAADRTTPSAGHNGENGAARRAAPPTAVAKPANGKANGSGGNGHALRELATETAKNTPEIRDELVKRYRKIIEEGRYTPDLEGVAERMIHQGLLKDL